MAKIERVKYFKAGFEDRPGALLEVMQALKKSRVSLSGLWGFATQPGKADLYVVAKDPAKLKRTWKRTGMVLEEGEGFFVKGADRPGALLGVLKSLSEAGINIQALDAVAVGGSFGSFIWLDPGKVREASRVLGVK
ncbi:MAG: hypothetical protein HY645_07765 [Acidobacteria bacterium]|nr:hypothetical protein [Acidobacteriota bacterium]